MTAPREPKYSAEFLAELKRRTRVVEVVGRKVRLALKGREHKGLCPFHNEKTPSFTVNEDKGFYHCFGCGAHGGAIDFLINAEGLTFLEAVEQLAVEAGMIAGGPDRPKPAQPAPIVERASPEDLERENAEDIAACQRIWARHAIPVQPGDPVDLYLRARGIVRRPLPPMLRHVPDLSYRDRDDPPGLRRWFPAMVGAVQNVAGVITGLHRTYLRADGGKAPVPMVKKMMGVCWGGAVRFGEPADALIVAEGLETALSIWQAGRPEPVWAALSLNNLTGAGKGSGPPYPGQPPGTKRPRLTPSAEPDMARPGIRYPDTVKRLLICGDADEKDRLGAMQQLRRAARREQINGRAVKLALPPEGHDFNSLLMSH